MVKHLKMEKAKTEDLRLQENYGKKNILLKECFLSLAGPEGNHGEDCQQLYSYLYSAPTHFCMKYLYKYNQGQFPYTNLINAKGNCGVKLVNFNFIRFIKEKHRTFLPVFISILFILLSIQGCGPANEQREESQSKKIPSYESIGLIERIDSELDSIIPIDAKIEVLSKGLVWAEGPLWVSQEGWLLCSDVKENKIYKWSEETGFEVYLESSGFSGNSTDSRERGSNGLVLDSQGRLVMCQHGNRQVARMNAPLNNPKPDFLPLATSYDGKRFNSPNDLIYDSKGNLYFTDPPYGLSEAMMDDPKKELPYQGVFKLDTTGAIILLTDKVSRPNGLAFSPDEKTLYVANTDENNASWIAFEVNDNGTLGEMEELLNVTDLIGKEVGFPDGIKVDPQGNIFTAGPGGLWVFDSEHRLIGKVRPGQWVSNCAFDDTFETLYITADDYLLRIKLHDK